MSAVIFEKAGQGEDVSGIVVRCQARCDGEARRSMRAAVRACAAWLPGGRAAHAMEEERRFVEQPLRETARPSGPRSWRRPQLQLLVFVQLLAGEDDDQGVSRSEAGSCIRSRSSNPDMSGSLRSSTQHSKRVIAGTRSACAAGAHRLSTSMSSCSAGRRCPLVRYRCPRRRGDASLCGSRRVLTVERASRALLVVPGLTEIGNAPCDSPCCALLFDREHLHRNVTRRRIELEVVQHRPVPSMSGQEHVERDGGRLVLPRERDAPPARGWRRCP